MKIVATTLILILMAMAASSLVYGEEIDIGPESIEIKSREEKKPAQFPHRRHQEFIPCMKCHHTNGQIMTVQKCIICHNSSLANKTLNNLKAAGHGLCKECHKEARKQGKDAPGRCSTCHPLEIRKQLS